MLSHQVCTTPRPTYEDSIKFNLSRENEMTGLVNAGGQTSAKDDSVDAFLDLNEHETADWCTSKVPIIPESLSLETGSFLCPICNLQAVDAPLSKAHGSFWSYVRNKFR